MKEFFDETNRYGEAAAMVDEQTYKALKPIFDFWIKEGYKVREISHLMSLSIFDIEMETILFSDNKKAKK